MGGGPSESDMRRMQVIRRRLFETPTILLIVRDGARISLTDGEGRTMPDIFNTARRRAGTFICCTPA